MVFQLTAFDFSADNDLGIEAYAQTITAPDPPLLTSVVRTGDIINVEWNEPENDGGSPITVYHIRYSEAGTKHSAVWISNIPYGETSYVIAGVKELDYIVAIAARNEIGSSGIHKSSIKSTVNPTATIPQPPEIVSLNKINDSMTVDWDIPFDNGGASIGSYQIRYKEVGSDRFSWSGYIPGSATSYIITGLSDSSYDVKMSAKNGVGVSVYSEVVNSGSVDPPPSQITILTLELSGVENLNGVVRTDTLDVDATYLYVEGDYDLLLVVVDANGMPILDERSETSSTGEYSNSFDIDNAWLDGEYTVFLRYGNEETFDIAQAMFTLITP